MEGAGLSGALVVEGDSVLGSAVAEAPLGVGVGETSEHGGFASSE